MEKKKHQWKGARRITIKKMATIPLMLTVFFSTVGHAQTLIYSWRDRAGTVHIVNDLNKVPLQYREGMKIYRIPSTRGAKEPRPRVSSEPVTRVKGGEEETLKEEWLENEIGEISGSITELRARLETLRQERDTKRIRMIRKRARGKTVVREKGKIEEIDREIEILTNQLGEKMEALRSFEQEKSLEGGP
jgi:predicted RNase H-like nuclease (RuvC/YqgF family)